MSDLKYYNIPIEEAKIGLVLAQPVHTLNGVLIAPKDDVVNLQLIKKLTIYDIDFITVYETDDIKNIATEIVYSDGKTEPVSKNLYTSIPDKQSYNIFKKSYDKKIEVLQSQFENFDTSKPIEKAEFTEISKNILNTLKSKNHLFNYLNSLRIKNDVVFSHCLNVSLLCNVFAQWLGYPEEEVKLFTLGGMLHDIGKLKIDESILTKKEPLTEIESDIMKTHVVKSYKMLEGQDLPHDLKKGILMHHERLDGSGYILGASKDQINIYARVIAIADMYDSLSHDRPYRDKFSALKVLKYLLNSVAELDYSLTSKLVVKIAKSFENSWAVLNTEEKCQIIYMNIHDIANPLVKVGEDIIDLSNHPDLNIIDLIY